MRWALPLLARSFETCGPVLGSDAHQLRCLLPADLELKELLGHGESGYVWRAQQGARRVALKFRCCEAECLGGRVCEAPDLRYECEAGLEAAERSPELVAGCLEPTKPSAFIVLKDVGAYRSAEESLEDFIQLDARSGRVLLRQLLRAATRMLKSKGELCIPLIFQHI